jgi:hypothetical protein
MVKGFTEEAPSFIPTYFRRSVRNVIKLPRSSYRNKLVRFALSNILNTVYYLSARIAAFLQDLSYLGMYVCRISYPVMIEKVASNKL